MESSKNARSHGILVILEIKHLILVSCGNVTVLSSITILVLARFQYHDCKKVRCDVYENFTTLALNQHQTLNGTHNLMN